MELPGRKFPNALKKFRRISGFTQKQVAAIIGHSTVTKLSNWENGSVMPTFKSVLRLSTVYKTLPNELYPELNREIRREIASRHDTLLKPYIPCKK